VCVTRLLLCTVVDDAAAVVNLVIVDGFVIDEPGAYFRIGGHHPTIVLSCLFYHVPLMA